VTGKTRVARRRISALVLIGAVLAGCAAPDASADSVHVPIIDDGLMLMADVARLLASTDDARTAAGGINDFGLELLRRLELDGSNAVMSPASIAIALGMARAGADGATAQEMDAVLRNVANPENSAGLNGLERALASRNQTLNDEAGVQHDVTLRLANATFAQQGMTIEEAYLLALAQTYGTGVRQVDYIGAPEIARQTVNSWVDEQTDHRIRELLQPDNVNEDTRLVLVNAIYLNAPWDVPFPEELTANGSFRLSDGATVEAPMMFTAGELAYARGQGWQAVDLPYLGDTLSMLLILPDDLEAFVAETDGARFGEIVASLSPTQVELSMPKFEIETRASLPGVLSAMGMPTAFTIAADFSGITRDGQLVIADVIHQANIDVEEKGTEAAAATAVIGVFTSGPPPTEVVLRLDHPFLFALRDIETGAIVFLGEVGDPSEG
jgi:serpin B